MESRIFMNMLEIIICLFVDRKDKMEKYKSVIQEREKRMIGVVFLEKLGGMGSILNKSRGG